MEEQQKLTTEERETWLWFHNNAYKEDINLAKKLLISNPRWSIICAYYSMHNLAKLYLGKIHNLKITGENVHARTLQLFDEMLKENKEKERIIKILKGAQNEFESIQRVSERTPYFMLKRARDERTKAQYYSETPDKSSFTQTFSLKASQFLEEFANPFTKIMEGML